MWAQRKGVEASSFPELIQNVQVCVNVEAVVIVGRVVLQIPLRRRLHVFGRPPFRLALIVDHIKADNL